MLLRGFLENLDARVLSYYYEALELRAGRLCRPRFAVVYPTYACNHDCVGCDYAELNRQAPTSSLSPADLHHILRELVDFGIRAVEFCGGGEPLLHPEIDQAIETLQAAGVGIGLLTNGTLVTDERATLLTRACSYVRVSIEAGTEEVFERVKRPKSPAVGFFRVVENLRRLLHHRARQQSPCHISCKYAIGQNNVDDVVNAVQLANELGVDSIQFKCARNVATELDLPNKQRLDEQLRILRTIYPKVPILGDLLPRKVTVPCWLTPLHVMIDPVGDVFLCCYYRHRIARHRYGNIRNQSLRDVWYSREHVEALRSIRREECEAYDCRFIRYSEVMSQALERRQCDFL